MARVTVEDCIDTVWMSNAFMLVLLSSLRARVISSGGAVTVDIQRDKPAVLALRELAGGSIHADDLEEEFIESLRVIPNPTKESVMGLEQLTKTLPGSPKKQDTSSSFEEQTQEELLKIMRSMKNSE